MELIKYEFKYVSGTTYNFKFNLTQNFENSGFFDVLEDSEQNVIINPFFTGTSVITGTTKNKLETLRTYSTSFDLDKRYLTSTSPTISNGLNLSLSNSGETIQNYIYYIDGITYNTTISGTNETTIFSCLSVGDAEPLNFSYLPIIKDETKNNTIASPIIESDIFLERQNISVFEGNYRLSSISTIEKLIRYGGGYFNVIENT